MVVLCENNHNEKLTCMINGYMIYSIFILFIFKSLQNCIKHLYNMLHLLVQGSSIRGGFVLHFFPSFLFYFSLGPVEQVLDKCIPM